MRKGGLYKRGDIWWARWCSDGKCYRVSTQTSSRREANERLRELVAPFNLTDKADMLRLFAAKAEGFDSQAQTSSKVNLPLSDAWDLFTQTTSRDLPRESTMDQYRCQWGRFLRWLEGTETSVKSLEDVTQIHAKAFIVAMRKALSNGTANKYLRFLRMFWSVLRTDGKTEAPNPWDGVALAREAQHSRRELTLEELRAVCEGAPSDLRALLALGLYTGLRLGDCATLKWSEVDLQAGLIRRVPSKSRKPKPVIVPVHYALQPILEALPRTDPFVLPEIARSYDKHSSGVTNRIQRHFKICGIQTTSTDERGRTRVDVGFHSLRHSFISLCRGEDIPLVVVEALVGHSSPAMTRHYSHTGQDAATRAINLLPSVFGAARSKTEEADALDDPQMLGMQIAQIAKRLNSRNWRDCKEELLGLGRCLEARPLVPLCGTLVCEPTGASPHGPLAL